MRGFWILDSWCAMLWMFEIRNFCFFFVSANQTKRKKLAAKIFCYFGSLDACHSFIQKSWITFFCIALGIILCSVVINIIWICEKPNDYWHTHTQMWWSCSIKYYYYYYRIRLIHPHPIIVGFSIYKHFIIIILHHHHYIIAKSISSLNKRKKRIKRIKMKVS